LFAWNLDCFVWQHQQHFPEAISGLTSLAHQTMVVQLQIAERGIPRESYLDLSSTVW
jgi:hypothetical protein